MKAKVLKNFSCNKIKRSIGNFLSQSDMEVIGDKFMEELALNDFIEMEIVPIVEMEIESIVEKKKKKK